MDAFVNKRTFDRINLAGSRFQATLALIEDENNVKGIVVSLIDLSRSGTGVYSKHAVEPGTRVLMSLESYPAKSLQGRIAWCRSSEGDPTSPADHYYRLGIEFTPADDDARDFQIQMYKHFVTISKATEK